MNFQSADDIIDEKIELPIEFTKCRYIWKDVQIVLSSTQCVCVYLWMLCLWNPLYSCHIQTTDVYLDSKNSIEFWLESSFIIHAKIQKFACNFRLFFHEKSIFSAINVIEIRILWIWNVSAYKVENIFIDKISGKHDANLYISYESLK